MKNKKNIIIAGLMMLALTTSPMYAQDTQYRTSNGIVDFNDGTASIVLEANSNQTLVGKSFRMYRLFDVENGQESVHYTLNEKYKSVVQEVTQKSEESEIVEYLMNLQDDSNQSQYRYVMESIQEKIKDLDADVIYVDDVLSNGSIQLSNLKYGYYMIEETTDVENTHSASSLLMVNTANPNVTIQIKSDYPDVVKKIYEDDQNVGWNDIADYEIGQNIPYKYETVAPDMSGYETYYFAFEDEMDSALSIDTSSIELKIGETISDAYSFSQTSNGFKLEITDLKKLASSKDKISVSYNAYLNENALNHLSSKGFENKVRLVYSNNPRSTSVGQTPWDSVVCFSYQLNGLKVNEKDTKLEGATFKLYRDEACTVEVYVKKMNDEYVVSQTRSSDSIVSNGSGSFVVQGLDEGDYYLKETVAPKGYQILKDIIPVSITPSFVQNRNNYVSGDSVITKLDATSADYVLDTEIENVSVQLKVVNQTGSTLPVTGSALTLTCVVAGASLMLYVAFKKKES